MAMIGAMVSTIQVSTSAALSSASPLKIEAWAGGGSNSSSASNAPGSQRAARHIRGGEDLIIRFMRDWFIGVRELQVNCGRVSGGFKHFPDIVLPILVDHGFQNRAAAEQWPKPRS